MKKILSSLTLVSFLFGAIASSAQLGAQPSDDNMTRILLRSIRKHADKPAFKGKTTAGWQTTTYREWGQKSEKVAAWLIAQGITVGDRVGVINFNNPGWPVVDLGIQMSGATCVPIETVNTGPQHNFVLHDSSIKVLFVMDQLHFDAIARTNDLPEGLKVVGILDADQWPPPSSTKLKELGRSRDQAPTAWAEGTMTLSQILESTTVPEGVRAEMEQRVVNVKPDDVFTICYTSGTTSATPDPNATRVYPGKGVVLTHRNLASNVRVISNLVSLGPDDVFASVLPMAHMFERTIGFLTPAANGALVCYVRSPATLAEDLPEISPTVMAAVPLLFERIYQGAYRKMTEGWIGKIVKGSRSVGAFFGANKERLLAQIVGKALKRTMGGRLRFAVSGGAALKKELAEFFQVNVGVQILEGYGLTESAPVLACNRPDDFEYGTVGRAVDQVEIKLADDGEILARGPNIFKEYLNLPMETAEAKDSDGWFHTGDRGAWNIEGRLKIIGRKKLIFKLATGRYISPETIETRLVHELVSQSLVVGANQNYAAALIFPSLNNLRVRAQAVGITGTDEELCNHPEINKIYKEIVDESLADLADFEKIEKFKLVPYVLTAPDELTGAQKVKRTVVTEKFQAQIDTLFQ